MLILVSNSTYKWCLSVLNIQSDPSESISAKKRDIRWLFDRLTDKRKVRQISTFT